MIFEQTGLPDQPVIRKAFDLLNDGVRKMMDENKDQIEQQIQMMKAQMREKIGDVEVPPEQEQMLEAQIRQQIEQSMDMPMILASQAAFIILDNASDKSEDERANLAAAAIAGMAASATGSTEAVLDELPAEVSTPAYEYWQASNAVRGGQSYEYAFAEVTEGTRAVALAHMVNQAQELRMMTQQMQQVQSMTGEIPPEIQVKRETLLSLRQGANFLGDVDKGLKAAFDDTFQRTSDTFAKAQVLPPPKPRPGMGGIKIMTL